MAVFIVGDVSIVAPRFVEPVPLAVVALGDGAKGQPRAALEAQQRGQAHHAQSKHQHGHQNLHEAGAGLTQNWVTT